MRFHSLLFSLFFLVANSTFAQSQAKVSPNCIRQANLQLDEALQLMQKHYYKKDSVQWDTLMLAARSRLNSSSTCDEAYETLKWCFSQIKEKHSFIMPPSKAAIYNGNVNSDGTMPEKVSGQIRSELIENEIAYIDIPWISTANERLCTAFADSIQQLIRAFDKQGINNWIIDLRRNSGGNCWPMLAGLGPLLGNGVYGYFVSENEKIPFGYNNGTMTQGRHNRCTAGNPYVMNEGPGSIIVLTGPNTASAGEIVALAFKGQDHVFFYGEPTAGLTTANATYTLSDGSILVLTVCKEADRTGRLYEGKIIPDEFVRPVTNSGKDAVKSSAIMFLQMK